MDRLDFQPAGRLQRVGEQTPCLLQSFFAAGFRAHLCDVLGQFLVGQHRPFAELLKQAPGHLRGSGLGIDEAQDALGPRARQQKPRHAVGQRMRLSRAGIRGHPGRAFRIGGGKRAHSRSQPLSDHSRTRARWS